MNLKLLEPYGESFTFTLPLTKTNNLILLKEKFEVNSEHDTQIHTQVHVLTSLCSYHCVSNG
jgi:hypothetical protein